MSVPSNGFGFIIVGLRKVKKGNTLKNFYLLGVLCACLALDTPVTKASDDDFEGFFGEIDPDKPVEKYAAWSDDEDQEPAKHTEDPSEVFPSTPERPPLSHSLGIEKPSTQKPVWSSSLQAYTYLPRSHGHESPLLEEEDDGSHDQQSQSVYPSSSIPTQAFLSGSYPKNDPRITPSSAIPILRRPSDLLDSSTPDDLQRSQDEAKNHRLRSWSKSSTDGPSQSPARHGSASTSFKEPSSTLLSTNVQDKSELDSLPETSVFMTLATEQDPVLVHERKVNS